MNESRKEKLLPLLAAAGAALIAMGLLVGGTYAWYSHNKRVTADTSSARSGTQELGLGISGSSGGPFDIECDISKVSVGDLLTPVSTADLTTFFANVSMENNMATHFVATETGFYHGQVYLQATATGQPDTAQVQIYLDSPGILVTDEAAGLMKNAARVGLVFTGATQDTTYIFNMSTEHNGGSDTFSNTALNGSAASGDVVLGGSAGSPQYVADPSVDPAAFLMDATGGSTTVPDVPLITMELNKVVTVDVYYYIEGCDTDCTNAIRTTEMSIALPFYGVLTGGTTG